MTGPVRSQPQAHRAGLVHSAVELAAGLSMTVGRGAMARAIADLAGLTAGDQVVDIGCGPGKAVREAARRGVPATGVDSSPLALRLARLISGAGRPASVDWVGGRAEALPLADGAATVVWAVSSVHHWSDRTAGLTEVRRVLSPGGRVLLAERLVRKGARGHGLTQAQAAGLARELTAAGFTGVRSQVMTAGRRTLVVVHGERPGGLPSVSDS